MTALTAYAPAKVNLSLHVGAVKPNGRHDLISLVTFADGQAADILSAEPSGTFSLAVNGPFAKQTGLAKDNLVLKAARLMNDALDGKAPTLAFRLTKTLPAAAGLGGGSADAAAALRLIVKMVGDPAARHAAEQIAPQLGGDVLACFYSRPGLMQGEGENFVPLEAMPTLPAVLVNPGVECPTGPVFQAYDQLPVEVLDHPPIRLRRPTPKALIRLLKRQTRNDLGAPAERLVPAIANVLQDLKKLPGSRLVRMSGSGATCFALYDTQEAAEIAAAKLAVKRPNSWIAVTHLGAGMQPHETDA
ncbi:MAG: 4-(cytidine 5'-diphospho)-2-C-methyl-D-erythritol kinase [Pseudomonadota bacterium]